MKFRITNSNIAPVTAYLQKLSPAKEYDVTVAIHHRNRTIPQLRLYWLHVTCLSDETGSDRDEVHAELKRLYLPSESVTGMYGETIVRPVSTSKLDTAQFSAYIEKVVAFASSTLGIILPMPGDLAFEQFEEYYNGRV
jgi:hypothetical protein